MVRPRASLGYGFVRVLVLYRIGRAGLNEHYGLEPDTFGLFSRQSRTFPLCSPLLYLGHQGFATVPFHRHGKVQPGPGVIVILQARQHQVEVTPVHTVLLSLEKHDRVRSCLP